MAGARRTDRVSDTEPVAFSNAIRLTDREWLGVGLFAVAALLRAPRCGSVVEPLPSEPDYRMPHDLGNDYWLYERCAELAAAALRQLADR